MKHATSICHYFTLNNSPNTLLIGRGMCVVADKLCTCKCDYGLVLLDTLSIAVTCENFTKGQENSLVRRYVWLDGKVFGRSNAS